MAIEGRQGEPFTPITLFERKNFFKDEEVASITDLVDRLLNKPKLGHRTEHLEEVLAHERALNFPYQKEVQWLDPETSQPVQERVVNSLVVMAAHVLLESEHPCLTNPDDRSMPAAFSGRFVEAEVCRIVQARVSFPLRKYLEETPHHRRLMHLPRYGRAPRCEQNRFWRPEEKQALRKELAERQSPVGIHFKPESYTQGALLVAVEALGRRCLLRYFNGSPSPSVIDLELEGKHPDPVQEAITRSLMAWGSTQQLLNTGEAPYFAHGHKSSKVIRLLTPEELAALP